MPNKMNIIHVADFDVSGILDSLMDGGHFSHLDEADSSLPGALVYCQDLRFLRRANENPNVSAIITTPALAAEPIRDSKLVIVADDPRYAFFTLYVDFHARSRNQPKMAFGIGKDCRIHPSAIVSSKAQVGDRVEIGPGVVIEDFVQIMDGTFIGSNAVVGAEGLLMLRHADGSLFKIKHAGGVLVGKGVEILAGAVVAKSLFLTPTTIGDHCQIGIMANIGHGVTIGEQSVISSNTVIAGRTKLGPNVWIGASASIAQGLEIGQAAQIKMGSVVISNILPNAVVSGNFAISHKTTMKQFLKSKKRIHNTI
jgi:UDP-3-O-[3-hydroxymyristoyl] glucosamine N-acyltransferase